MVLPRSRALPLFFFVLIAGLALAFGTLCGIPVALAAPMQPFSLAPTITASLDDVKSQLLAEARIDVDAVGHVICRVNKTFDYTLYAETDAAHRYPIRITGQGSVEMTGEYDPDSYRTEGRYRLEFRYESSGGFYNERGRTTSLETGTFSALITGPGKEVLVTLQYHWTARVDAVVGGVWKEPFSTAQGDFTKVYAYRQVGGPTPRTVATVLQSGASSMIGVPRAGGVLDWRPLRQGDVLTPGCIIRTGSEGDPESGGGRVKIALSDTFTVVIEPYSRVEILEGGVRVESGSVEADDKPPFENYNAYNDNGFCSGKDPGAVQPPFSGQALSPAAHLASAAAASSRYRFETLSDGTARVSVLEGAAEARSAATQAKVLLRAGQQITLTPQGLGPVSEKSFTDVPSAHPYRTAIIGMSLKEIVSGYRKGDLWEFRPLDPVKRAQFAKMIVGAMMIAPRTSTQTRFSDLGSPDAAGYPHVFVQAAYEYKITTGTNAAQTLFAPWDPIRRAQVVTMIVRAANELWPGVLEAPPAGWSGAMAAFNDPNHGANMRTAEYNGLLAGLQGFGQSWDPYKQASRGEVAQILWNLMTR